jgi:hypothetical protein
MNFTSPKTRVNLPAKKLFEWSGNFQNFAHYLSDHAKDISATEDTCSFTIENITKITLKILEKTPFKSIRFAADNDKNITLILTLNYTTVSETETDVEVTMDIDIPIFLKPILQQPLQRFVDTLSEKIKISTERIEL